MVDDALMHQFFEKGTIGKVSGFCSASAEVSYDALGLRVANRWLWYSLPFRSSKDGRQLKTLTFRERKAIWLSVLKATLNISEGCSDVRLRRREFA